MADTDFQFQDNRGLPAKLRLVDNGDGTFSPKVSITAAASAGSASTVRFASAAASTNATRAKAAAGNAFQASGKNNAAYDVHLVLYDSAVSPPVPGTTAIRKKLICPAGSAFVYDFHSGGMAFASGIGFAFTKLAADADTTALAAGDITDFNLDFT